jgi:23S rRNA G2445 N2-methylase RlmL
MSLNSRRDTQNCGRILKLKIESKHSDKLKRGRLRAVNVITSRPLTLELYGSPGTLPEVAADAVQIIAQPWKPHKFVATVEVARGFVRVRNASWELACELAARLSTVHDLCLAFLSVTVKSWTDVPLALGKLPFKDLLEPGATLEVRAEAANGVLPHAGRLQEIAEEFFSVRGYTILLEDEARDVSFTRIELETGADRLRVRVSLGSDALHKRGWRALTGTPATLREDLASAVLKRLTAFESRALQATQVVVPFAGSGTLGVEAWHSLYGLPPSIWNSSRAWKYLVHPTDAAQNWWDKRITRAATEAKLPELIFIENNRKQFHELKQNLENVTEILEDFGLELPKIPALLKDVFQVPNSEIIKPRAITLMPLHPPYGLRLSQETDVEKLFTDLGLKVREWALESRETGGALIGFCLCPSDVLWRCFRNGLGDLEFDTSHVTQGGLDVRVCNFSSLKPTE